MNKHVLICKKTACIFLYSKLHFPFLFDTEESVEHLAPRL